MRRFLITPGAAIVFAGVALLLAWPLPLMMGHGMVASAPAAADSWARADFDLTAWILAWGTHALSTAPSTLFAGNLFHPATNILAGSENLLGLQPLTAPLFLLTGNAVLAQNGALLILAWLSAFTTFLALRRWTGLAGPALLAGLLFGFAPQIAGDNWIRVHWAAVSLLPLITMLAWSAAAAPRWKILAALLLAVSVQILAGIYVAYALAFWLLALAPGLALEARRHVRSPLPCFLAIATAGLAAIPVGLPYLEHGLGGGIDPAALAVILGAMSPTASALAARLLEQLGPLGIGLAAVGLMGRSAPPRRLRLSLLAGGALGFALSAGVQLPALYDLFGTVVPGFASIRGPVRFFVLPILATALLAGCGVADLLTLAQRRVPRSARIGGPILLALLAIFVVAERRPAGGWKIHPVPAHPAENDPYFWLAEHGEKGALLELPMHRNVMEPGALRATGRAMLGSTRHWLPILNGYTGHPPASSGLIATLATRLPDARAFADLCAITDLRWILLHTGLDPATRARWQHAEGLPLRRAQSFPRSTLFEVTRKCGEATERLRAELAGERQGRTLGDIPLDALDTSALRAELRLELPIHLRAGVQQWIKVSLHNHGELPWPGLTSQTNGRLALQTRWRIGGGDEIQYNDAAAPLAADLQPGETLPASVGAFPPQAGEHILEIGLVQEGRGWLADLSPNRELMISLPVTTTPFGGQ
ncbi:MAG: hypothetical protein VCC00_03695 [Deltaproteobacteria bacterium]